MLMNIPIVAKMYATNNAHPAVKTHRIRLIVSIGSRFDHTISRCMLYQVPLTVTGIPEAALHRAQAVSS